MAAIEQMKWNQLICPRRDTDHDEYDSDEEIQQLKQRIRIRRSERFTEVSQSINYPLIQSINQLICPQRTLYRGEGEASIP